MRAFVGFVLAPPDPEREPEAQAKGWWGSSPLGPMLEMARLMRGRQRSHGFAPMVTVCAAPQTVNDREVVRHQPHRVEGGSEMLVRDDAHFARNAGLGHHQGDEQHVAIDQRRLRALAIWRSLGSIEREVLVLLEQGTRWDAVQTLTERGVRTTQGGLPTDRYVRRVAENAGAAILGHPLFSTLAE